MEVGSRVVCVDSSVRSEHIDNKIKLFQQWVEKDKHYTIREILNNDDIVDGVLLEEIVNDLVYQPLLNRVQEPAFAMWRFRELQEDEEMEIELEEELIKFV